MLFADVPPVLTQRPDAEVRPVALDLLTVDGDDFALRRYAARCSSDATSQSGRRHARIPGLSPLHRASLPRRLDQRLCESRRSCAIIFMITPSARPFTYAAAPALRSFETVMARLISRAKTGPVNGNEMTS